MINKIVNWYGKPIILASASPRRRQILQLAGIDFSVQKSNYHEPGDEHTKPDILVQNHAKAKAFDVAVNFDDAWIIGADTIVVKDDHILEKPKNKADAQGMLRRLSGTTHVVYTGYCILNSNNKKYVTDVEKTEVHFHQLSDDMINLYIDNYSPFDKAGSYGIQDFSAIFVRKINGCFYNVVGFPIAHFIRCCLANLKSLL